MIAVLLLLLLLRLPPARDARSASPSVTAMLDAAAAAAAAEAAIGFVRALSGVAISRLPCTLINNGVDVAAAADASCLSTNNVESPDAAVAVASVSVAAAVNEAAAARAPATAADLLLEMATAATAALPLPGRAVPLHDWVLLAAPLLPTLNKPPPRLSRLLARLLLLPPSVLMPPPPPPMILPALRKLSHFEDSISFAVGFKSMSLVMVDDHWLGAGRTAATIGVVFAIAAVGAAGVVPSAVAAAVELALSNEAPFGGVRGNLSISPPPSEPPAMLACACACACAFACVVRV